MFKKFLLIIGLFTICNQSVQTFAEIIPLKKPIQGKKEFTATVDVDAGFTSFSFETEDQEAMESVGIDIDDLSDFMTDSMF